MYKRCSVLVAVLLLAICLTLLTGCKPESLVSTSQEIEIGRQASQDIERQYGVVKDPALNATVNNMGQSLAKCSERPDITYTFKILNIKDVNAVSLPGGWVYVYKGLVDQTKGKPDELAGVIAHEIGHVAARHHAQMLGREIQASLIIGTLTKGDTQQIASIFANLQLLHYSREQEYEADKLGIKEMWLCRQQDPAVYNSQGLIDFFGALLKMEGKPPSNFEQIFRTHPVTAERIKRAQAFLDDLRAGRTDP